MAQAQAHELAPLRQPPVAHVSPTSNSWPIQQPDDTAASAEDTGSPHIDAASTAVQSPHRAGGPAQFTRIATSSTIGTGLSRIWSRSTASLSRLDINRLGFSTAWENISGKDHYVIRIAKLGWILVLIHISLAVFYLFGITTSLYGWISSKDNDRMMQQILKGVNANSLKSAKVDEYLTQWYNNTKSAEDTCTQAEQSLWDAFLKVFDVCARSLGQGNNTDLCDDLRRHFANTTLPRLDGSAIAKRNLVKLDAIIRQKHLGMSADISRPSDYIWQMLMYILTPVILMAGVYAFALVFRRLFQQHHRRFLNRSKSRTDEKQDQHATDEIVPTYATGSASYSSGIQATYRGHKIPNIHSLAARGALEDLRNALAQSSTETLNTVDQAYGSIVSAAARSGDPSTLEFVLSLSPDLSLEGGRYHCALQAAAHSGNDVMVDMLLRVGAQETTVGGFYGTTLNAAAEKCTAAVLDTLFRSNAVIMNAQQMGGTYGFPLIAAAARGDVESVDLLIAKGADINQADPNGTSALHQASAHGHLVVLHRICASHTSLDKQSDTLGTALHAACNNKHTEAAKILLANGADPCLTDVNLQTALHVCAASEGHLNDILDMILAVAPGSKDKTDVNGNTALHHASMAGNVYAVRALLARGADCSIGDKFAAQPLFRAAGCGHPAVVEVLLEVGRADPNATDSFGRTALHGPAQTDDVRVHELLLQYGADVNAVGSDKKTALHEACNMGRIKNVELLLTKDETEINKLDNDQFPPLYKALCSSDGNPKLFGKCLNEDIPRILLQRDDLDVNIANGIAVQEAARKGYVDMIQTMLHKHNANIRIHGGKYGSVLQAAAIGGNLELVNVLLTPEHHLDVNQAGGEYGSALAAAAAFGHVDVVQRLLEAGGDPNLAGDGRYGTPMQSVCRRLDSRVSRSDRYSLTIPIERLLEEYGGITPEIDHQPHLDWRWNNLTTGWGWQAPGEM